MLVSYPVVNERGELTGAEVTFRLGDIVSIEHLLGYFPRGEEERYRLVPNCINITIRNEHEFMIQADYNELKARMTDLNEWTE